MKLVIFIKNNVFLKYNDVRSVDDNISSVLRDFLFNQYDKNMYASDVAMNVMKQNL